MQKYNIRVNLKLRVFLVLIVASLVLLSCDKLPATSFAVVTSFAVDASESNVNSSSGKKVVSAICKEIIKKMSQKDTLILKKFDSIASPNKSDIMLKNKNQKGREEFSKSHCNDIFSKSPRPKAMKGTSISKAWDSFYSTYKERIASSSKKTTSNDLPSEIVIFYIDALENEIALDSKNSLNSFLNSVQEFILNENYLLVIIQDDKDRFDLQSKVNSIKDVDNRMRITDGNRFSSDTNDFFAGARNKKAS